MIIVLNIINPTFFRLGSLFIGHDMFPTRLSTGINSKTCKEMENEQEVYKSVKRKNIV